MTLRRSILTLIFVFNLLTAGIAQTESDTVTFAKGRSITSLFGSLDNQRVNLSNGRVFETTAYTIGTKSGKFIKDNWTLGLNFSLSRGEIENTLTVNKDEGFTLGLWSRLYFAESKSLALYGELTPLATSIYRESKIFGPNGNLIVDEVASGGGFGIEPGFGFVYIINRNVGFGMTLSYTFADMKVDVEDLILETTTPEAFLVHQLRFSFNFQIYLDQFFF